jgi:hypothetical protein
VATVRFDDSSRDRQPESRAVANRPPRAAWCLIEALEHMRELLGRDPLSRVCDDEEQLARVYLRRERDRPPGRGELDGVPDQVGQQLHETVGIDERGGKIG